MELVVDDSFRIDDEDLNQSRLDKVGRINGMLLLMTDHEIDRFSRALEDYLGADRQ